MIKIASLSIAGLAVGALLTGILILYQTPAMALINQMVRYCF